MKKLLVILTLSFNVLTFCLVVMFGLFRYYLAVFARDFYIGAPWKYIPAPLIILILISFVIQLYIIFREDLKERFAQDKENENN